MDSILKGGNGIIRRTQSINRMLLYIYMYMYSMLQTKGDIDTCNNNPKNYNNVHYVCRRGCAWCALYNYVHVAKKEQPLPTSISTWPFTL